MQQQKKPRWPNLFIVGAARAGTSSLHRYLSTVEEVYMSPRKEPHFFSHDFVSHLGCKVMSYEEDYLALFANATTQRYLGESSTSYLPCAAASLVIFERMPSARIIVSLRDPVERAFSHYLMELRSGSFNGSFEQEINRELSNYSDRKLGRLHLCHYVEKIEQYISAFGSQQVKILVFEDWVKQPDLALSEILKFLELHNTGVKSEHEVHNRYHKKTWFAMQLRRSKTFVKVARKAIPESWRITVQEKILTRHAEKPAIDRAGSELLIEYYKNDVIKLEALLNRRLPWKWFQ